MFSGGSDDASQSIETDDPGLWDSYVKPVLDSTPVRAATGLLSGFSDIAGGIAEEAKAALSGVQSRVKLSPEGIRQYAEDVGASSAPINPLTIDVARRGYEVPGVEQIAKEGIAQGIDTAAGAVGIDTDLSRADLSRAGGVQGPRGVAAAIAEGVGEFALGLGTDPISGAYLKANRSMQIAQDALARAEDIARTAPGLAQGAARRADDLLKAAQAEEWAAKQVDLGTGLAALPAIGGQALEQGQAAVEEYQRNGLTPAAAEAATQAALGLAGVGMVGMDARDVRRSMAERQRAEMAPDAHVRQFRTAPDELSLSPQEASGIESLRGLPEAPSTGPDIPAIEVGDLWAQERPDPRKAPTAGPVLGVDDMDLPSAEALVLEDQARAEEEARRAETAHYLLDPEPAPPEPGLPDVWQGDSPLPDPTLLPTEDAARMQWAAESDLLSRVMQERQRRDADRARVQEVRARALAEDIAAGRLGPEVQPAPAIEGDLESLIPDVGLHNLPTLPPGFGAMGADPGRARVPTPQLPPGFGGMGAEGRFPEALPEAPARQPRPAPASQEPPADVRGLDVAVDEEGVRVLPGEETLSPGEREAIDVATGEALRQAKALREQNVVLHSRMRDRILAAAGVLESDSEPTKRKKLQSGAETVLYEEQSRGLVDPNVERMVDLALRDVTRETLGVKAREKKRLSDAAALVGTPLEGVDLSVKEIEKALRDDKGNRTEMKIREMVRENLARGGEDQPPEYTDEVPFMARRPVRQEGPGLFDQPGVREDQPAPDPGPLFRGVPAAQPVPADIGQGEIVSDQPANASTSEPSRQAAQSVTLSGALGIEGKIKAEFVRGDWMIRPDRYIADRAEWAAAGRSLSEILPDGSVLRDGEGSVTMRRDSRGIPELVGADGKVWTRLGSSNAVEDLVRNFGHATIERPGASATRPAPTPEPADAPATTIERTKAGDQRTLVSALDTTSPIRPASGFHDSPLFNPERAAEDRRLEKAQGRIDFMERGSDVDSLGFFSHLGRVVADPKTPKAATGYDWQRFLTGKGAKAEEMKWTGLDDFLRERAGKKVTREEIQEHLRANDVRVEEVTLGVDPNSKRARVAAKFDRYQLPGGESYREVVLYTPERPGEAFDPAKVKITRHRTSTTQGTVTLEYEGRPLGTWSDEGTAQSGWQRPESDLVEMARRLWEKGDARNGIKAGSTSFKSSHFPDTPGSYLAHLRLSDRIDADGKRVLFVEEVQSDLAQKGRKEGFAQPEPGEQEAALLQRNAEINERELPALRAEYRRLRDLVPVGPDGMNVESSPEYAAMEAHRKMMVGRHKELTSEMADNESRIMQLKRERSGPPAAPFVGKTEAWSELVMKRILRLAAEGAYDRVAWTQGDVQVERYRDALRKAVDRIEWTKTKDGIHLKGFKDGKEVVDTREKESAISDAIGKSMGDQIIGDPEQSGVLEGDDITISDTGMAGFYDRILPGVVGRLGKKFGAKVGETYLDGRGLVGTANDNSGNAAALGAAPVHSIDVTPEMRRSVMEGQPRFLPTKEGSLKEAARRVRDAEARDRVPVGRVDIASHDAAHDAVARSLAQALGSDAAEAVRRGAASISAQVARKMGTAAQSFAGFTVDGEAFGYNLDGRVRLNILAELERAQVRAATKRTAGGASEPRELARGIVNVLVHEIAHGSIKGHGPEHAAEMLKVMRSLAGRPMQQLRASIERALTGRIDGLGGALREARVAWGEADGEAGRRGVGGSDRRPDGGRPAEAGDRPGAGAAGGAGGEERRPGLAGPVPGGVRGEAGGVGSAPERGRGGTEVASRVPKTETPEFRRWFGESKVVDADGKPKLMLHGTGTPGFTAFDRERQDPNALYGPGFYFTEAPEVAGGSAKAYQRTAAFPTEQEARRWAGRDGELYHSESQGLWLGTRPATEVVAGGYAGKGVADMHPDEGLRALDAIEGSPEYQQIIHGRDVGGGQRFHSVSSGEREHVEDLAKSVRQDLEDGSSSGRLEGLIRELGAQPYNLPVRHILAEEGFAHESGGVMGAHLKIERPFDADAEYSGAEAHRIMTLAGGDVPHISRFKDAVKGSQIIEAIRGVPWKMGQEPLRTKKFRIQDTLKAAGYDGITHVGGAITGADPHRVFIAFDPTQIKSAIGNRGTFDPENPDVRFAKRTAAERRAAELADFKAQADRLRGETAREAPQARGRAVILDAMDRVNPMAGGGTGKAPSIGVPELWEATRGQFRDRAEFDQALLQLQQEGRIGTTRGDTGLSPEQFEASTVDPARPDSRIFAVYKRGEPSFMRREGSPPPRTDLKRNHDGSLAFDEPPRVEGKVEDFYRAAREAGIKDIDLKRDHPRTWESLMPDVRRALGEPNAEAKLLKKATDGKLTDTDVLALDALRDGYRQQFERLKDERAKAADPGAVNAQIIDSAFRTAAVEYARVAKSDVQAGTALGRALAARRAVMQGFLKGKRLASAPDAFIDKVFRELPDVTPEQAAELARVATSNRPELLADALHAYVHPAGPRQIAWWLELWKASILSGPGTQVANISGNAVEVPMRVAETLTSAAVDAITSRLTGAERTRYAGEAGMELRGAMKGAKAGLPQLVADLKDIIHARPERVDLNARFEYQVGHISGKKGRIIRTPFRLLQAADRFFKSLGNGAEMGKLAWREAERELGQAAGRDAIRARAAEITEEASRPEAGPKWQQLLEDVNRGETSRVFQDDPAGIVHLLLRARAQYPVLHFVLPFVQTPANIASLTLERLGGGFLAARKTMKALEQAKAAGAPDAAISRLRGQAMDELARPTFGLAMMTALAGAAAQGALTGSGPADQEEKAALRETGWQPYSVRIDVGGGRSVFIPYNRLEPASSLVGIAADIVESKDSRRAADLFAKGMASIAQNITSKSYLEGLSNAVEVIHDPARSMRGFVAGLAGSLVPNIVASASRAVDPAVRDVAPDTAGLSGMPDAAWRKIVSRIPGASFSLPQRLGPTGERIERPGSAVERFLLPSQVSATKGGKEVEAEIARVGGKAAPGSPSRDMVVGQGRKVRLTDEEFLLLGEGMQRAAERVRKLMDAPAYRALPDTEDEGGANSKEAKIRRIWDQAREESRARVRRLVLRRLAA